MNKETTNILVGALVVVVGVLVFFLSHRGGPTEPTSGYSITARFSAIDGVAPGTKLLLAGIPIGEVTEFEYELDSQRAAVSLTVQDGIKIPLDSVVLIVTDGLLGNKYLKSQPGGEEERMQDGDEFEYVQDSIIFEEILEKVILNAEQQRNKKKQEKKDPESPPNQASAGETGTTIETVTTR